MSLNVNDQKVLKVLAELDKPMSAYDILHAVQGTAVKAPTQVYRSLEKLMGSGHVHRIETLNAFVVCGCKHVDAAPGFFVCKGCGDVTEFDSREAMGALATLTPGYRVDRISVELSGSCPSCCVLEGVPA